MLRIQRRTKCQNKKVQCHIGESGRAELEGREGEVRRQDEAREPRMGR